MVCANILLSQDPAGSSKISEPLTASIIIPHWNGLNHIDACLGSLRKQSCTNFEIILVDNGSTDGSQGYIAAHFPEVRLLELGENLGFTGACNAGYEYANGELIILLNNDTETEPTWLEAIVDAFDRHPKAGIVASKIMLFDERDRFHSAGDLYRLDGIPVNRGVWQVDDGQFEVEEPVFSACGAAAAYRRTLIEDIGFLDDSLFFSCEDVDMGWRALFAGWEVLYVPSAVVYHKLKATGGSEVGSYYDGRNFLYLLWKHYPSRLWRSHWRQLILAQLVISWRAIKAWRGKAARARLRGQLAGLLGFPKMRRLRKDVDTYRRVSNEYIAERLSPVDDIYSDK